MKKEDFLQSVQEALGKRHRVPQEMHLPLQEGLAQLEARTSSLHERLHQERPQLLDKLAEAARAGGWKVCRAVGTEEALSYVSDLVRSMQVSLAVRSGRRSFSIYPSTRF